MSRRRVLTHLLLLLWLVTTGLPVQPALAAERPIYVVQDWQAYLRLVPVSVRNGYIPLLYNPHTDPTPAIRHFAALYRGSIQILDAEGIEQVVARQWSQAETIVVAEAQPQLGMIAAAIAAELDSPLFFDLPTVTALQQLRVRQVIAVGDVALPAQLESVRLHDSEEAQAYYNALIGTSPVAVLATAGSWNFLAAGVAAHHRGTLLLSPDEIQDQRPRHLVWVTRPQSVTRPNVYALYEACRFTPGSRVYDVNVGILTGLARHDVALLMARTYAYRELDGEWKTRAVTASDRAVQIPQVAPLENTLLVGKALSGEALLAAMRDAGYVWIEAHGDPGGLALPDGPWPTDPRDITDLPPLVFVAESCKTGDITGAGVDRSLALHIVAAGAVAYVGSMEMGGVGLFSYALSTPAAPLGALVRLQNALRMDVDADGPRAILIGDPTFCRFEDEWVDYEVVAAPDSIRVRIHARSAHPSPVIALELPDATVVRYARVRGAEGREIGYMPGLFERALASAPTFGHTTVLLEWPGGDGDLLLHARAPLEAWVRRSAAHGLLGVGCVLDLLGQRGAGMGWALAIANGLILRRVWLKRRHARAASVGLPGAVAGVGMSVVGVVYALSTDSDIPWLAVAVLGCWAFTVVWMLCPRWGEWKRLGQSLGAYAAPLILAGLWGALLGGSRRLMILLALGILLTEVAYGLLLLTATALAAGQRTGIRSRHPAPGPEGAGSVPAGRADQ